MRSPTIVVSGLVLTCALGVAGCTSAPTATPASSAPMTSAPMTSAPASPSASASSPAASGTIVDVASGNEDFSTLVAAVKAAGLVETLSGAGPFTVFAPTNAAFEKLPDGLVEKLLEPANKDVLTKILTYHVVSGKVMAADVEAGKVETVEGTELTVTTDGGVMVDKAKVTATDVEASNGVIHVIDTVLVPAGVDVADL